MIADGLSRSFHRGAVQYDRHTPVQQRVVQRLLEHLAAELSQKPQRVLDIGCGTGQLLQQLAQQYPHASLTGLDLAHNMLQLANERLGGSASLLQGDAERLPCTDMSFDLVVSTSTFQWLEQCATLLWRGASGVARRVGCFVLPCLATGTLFELQSCWREALLRNNRPVLQGAGWHPPFPYRDQVRRSLELQGFTAVEVTTQQEQVWYPDLPQLLQAIKRIGAGTAHPQRVAGA